MQSLDEQPRQDYEAADDDDCQNATTAVASGGVHNAGVPCDQRRTQQVVQRLFTLSSPIGPDRRRRALVGAKHRRR